MPAVIAGFQLGTELLFFGAVCSTARSPRFGTDDLVIIAHLQTACQGFRPISTEDYRPAAHEIVERATGLPPQRLLGQELTARVNAGALLEDLRPAGWARGDGRSTA